MEAHLDGCDGKRTFVGPAKAGTHNHRRLWLRKVSTNVPNTNGTAYGSRLSPGRRKMMQTVKQQTHIRVLAARCARGVDESSAQRGRGERRMPVAPAASRALGIGRTHTSKRVPRNHPTFPHAMALTVSFVLSPVTGLVCHRRPRTNVVPKPGRADITSANLTPASGRQDHTTSPYAATSLVRSLLIAHKSFNSPCNPIARKTLPRPPHPSPRP